MKKYIVICMVLCTFLLAACQVKNPEKSAKPKQSETVRLEKPKNLEIGNVYRIGSSKKLEGSYLKLIDNNRYVYMMDYSHDTQEEIDDINHDEDSVDFYPYILFTEGQYTKDGDNLNLTPTETIDVEFKDPDHVKDKIIASKRLDEGANAGRTLTVAKEDSGYVKKKSNGSFPLYKTNKKLPNSIDDFLAQYDYQPEELP